MSLIPLRLGRGVGAGEMAGPDVCPDREVHLRSSRRAMAWTERGRIGILTRAIDLVFVVGRDARLKLSGLFLGGVSIRIGALCLAVRSVGAAAFLGGVATLLDPVRPAVIALRWRLRAIVLMVLGHGCSFAPGQRGQCPAVPDCGAEQSARGNVCTKDRSVAR